MEVQVFSRAPNEGPPEGLSLKDGGYGVTVNTEACGAFNSGSIPDSHPKIKSKANIFLECPEESST
jgi:hypothetical protein